MARSKGLDMNETVLFNYLRRAPFGGRLSQGQVDGVKRIIRVYEQEYPDGPDEHLAYILATCFHETGARMQPVRESFATSDAQAKRRLESAWKSGRLGQVSKPYWRQGYFGRGDVQLTHRTNYRKMGLKLGLDLVNKPSLALKPEISAQIMIVGMTEGLYTGKSLNDYTTEKGFNAVAARRVVNGTDKSKLIAGYYKNFLDSIKAAREAPDMAPIPDAPERGAEPDQKSPQQSPTFWTLVVSFFTGIVTALGNITSVFAFAGLALVLVAALVVAWAVFTGRLKIERPWR